MSLRAAIVSAATVGLWAQTAPAVNPFAFFEPTLVVTAADRRRLDAGEPVVRTVGGRGRELAIFSASRIDVGGDRLVVWVRRVDDLKRGRYVPQIGIFSQRPRIEDVNGLTLDEDDLEGLRQCRSGDCDLKLSDAEIAEVRRAIAGVAGDWRSKAQEAFRQIVVSRARIYLTEGYRGIAPYHDRKQPVSLEQEFEALMKQSGFLTERLPELANHLKAFPFSRAASVESFLYWSKETLGGKPIVAVTHVNVVRPGGAGLPEALVAARQVYSTHYMTGSLAITAILGAPSGPRYLVYLNRSRLDVLDGMFGGFVRRIVERRLRGEAAEVVQGLRRRLEGGEPPGAPPER